jgi:hypothetical protein
VDSRSAYVKIKNTGEGFVLRHHTVLQTWLDPCWYDKNILRNLNEFASMLNLTEIFVKKALPRARFLVS